MSLEPGTEVKVVRELNTWGHEVRRPRYKGSRGKLVAVTDLQPYTHEVLLREGQTVFFRENELEPAA